MSYVICNYVCKHSLSQILQVEHVKFVDFCGKYKIPLLQYLCSSRCRDDSSSGSNSNAISVADDDEYEAAAADASSNDRMRRVLLG